MTVENFNPSEVKISPKVKSFYHAVHNGKPYTGGYWSDTIAEFDEGAKNELQRKMEMKKHYDNSTRCKRCGALCVVRQIKTNKNGNQGKFFLSCPVNTNEDGHTWEFVNTMPLLKSSEASNNSGDQTFGFLAPGVNGVTADMLFEDKRFVLTGVFPGECRWRFLRHRYSLHSKAT